MILVGETFTVLAVASVGLIIIAGLLLWWQGRGRGRRRQ